MRSFILFSLAAFFFITEASAIEPLSLDPPPATIPGAKYLDVLAFLGTHGYKTIPSSPTFCHTSGFYQSSQSDADYINVCPRSYNGKDDLVDFYFSAGGNLKPVAQHPETMSRIIDKIAEQSGMLCADEEQKSRLGERIREKLKTVAYASKDKTPPQTVKVPGLNGSVGYRATMIDGQLRVEVSGYVGAHEGTAGVTVRITPAKSKTWSDKAGKFQVEAAYLSSDSKQVKLVKSDGKEIAVALSKLCQEDRDWITEETKPEVATVATAAEPPAATAAKPAKAAKANAAKAHKKVAASKVK